MLPNISRLRMTTQSHKGGMIQEAVAYKEKRPSLTQNQVTPSSKLVLVAER